MTVLTPHGGAAGYGVTRAQLARARGFRIPLVWRRLVARVRALLVRVRVTGRRPRSVHRRLRPVAHAPPREPERLALFREWEARIQEATWRR